ncbi:MAG: RHS repeat protein, partial [Chitinophagaceae bacterium]|nr:RHS repeat protein [Chitinophagaceae bacterium]
MKKLFIFSLLPALILVLCAAVDPVKTFGIQPPVLQVLDGSLGQLSKDSFNIVSDTLFFDPSYNSMLDKHYMVRNTVRLRINPYSPYFLKRTFSATLRLEIAKTDVNGTVTTFDTSLTVRYNKDSLIRDGDSYLFSNAYRVKVKVIDRQTDANWDVWKSLTLENELQSFPVFTFDCSKDTINSVSHATLDSNSVTDELPVNWTQVTSADQYDLEWTYIDSSALKSPRHLYGDPANPDATLIFGNSSSRVTITGTSYNIPLLYDGTGTLFFRVRPVQLQAGGGRSEGHWHSDKQTPGSFYFKGHQRNLNWQSTATFAEEGKRKVVVQYYDGSLRGRQTVTKDNTTNTTVVSESFYDYQGRPVIQVLPSPTFSNVIKYSQNFNLGLNGNAYDKRDFDTLADPSQYCNSGANAMGTGSGSSQYYSTANPDRDTGVAKYIPDAGGYPFTEVEYLQDNTGRISRQSGVGPRHRLGSGHETKYFYGTPDQRELDALFGTEVGDFSHYFKTVVQDANGQFSVSYTDMHGRTIATALANVPDSTKLDTLSSYRAQRITETLSTPTSNVVKDLVMESKKGLIVSMPGTHTFNYILNPASLQLPDCNNYTVCYDCLYDLEITITSDCNNQKLQGGQPFDTVFHNFSLGGRPDTTCGKPADSFAVSFSKYLQAGSYEITKRLSVSRYGENYYRDSVFMKRNSCRDINSFLQEQRAIQASITQCAPTCQSCIDSLGDWSSYYSRFIARTGIAPGDSSYKDMILSAYKEAQASCQLICDNINEADNIRQAMLLDMTPPSGQYANQDSTADPYSIFYVHKDINGNQTDVTEPVYTRNNNYLDENGNPDLVYDEKTDRMVKPQDLTPEAFAQKFKLPWAEGLLQYHPEYQKLVAYEQLGSSNDWDKRFGSVDTYAEAMKKGYLNPTGNTNAPFNRYNATVSADYDPVMVQGYMSSLNDSLKAYINRASTGNPNPLKLTLWGFATATIRCAGGASSCMNNYAFVTNNDDSAFNSNMCTGDLDMAWRTFRQAYLDIKRKLINARLKSIPSIPSTNDLLAAGHQPHFTDADELIQAVDLTPPSDKDAASQQSQTAINNYYDANCRAYVTMWWQNLQKPCNYNATDSAIIIPRLIQVCKEGSDGSHPYGASSVSPSSSYQYKSFEDVIQQYNAGKSKPATCNVYGIKAPKPYDQQLAYSNKPLWTRPDSCECDHIQSIYRNYQAVASHYLSFSDYVYKAYHTSMPDSTLSQLRTMCTVPPGTAGCNYLATPIQLPPAMQCSTGDICVGCTQFKSLDAEFRSRYPQASPVAAPLPTDSAQLAVNQLYEQFMSYRLGYTKTAGDYLSFLNSCNGTPNGGSLYDSLQTILNGAVCQYNAQADSLVNTHQCNYTNWVIGSSNELTPGAIRNGVTVMADTVTPLYYRSIVYVSQRDFCINNAISYEARIKAPIKDQNGVPMDCGDVSFNLWNSSNNSIPTDVDEGIYFQLIPYCGSGFYRYRGVRYNDTALANKDFEDWHVVKYKITPTKGQLFYDGRLIKEIPRDGNSFIYKANFMPIVFKRAERAQMDWFKIYDGNDNVIFSEDFDNAPGAFARPNVASLCPKPDCKDFFTWYFNSQTGSNYTYSQIDSLYRKNGIILPCSSPGSLDSVVDVPVHKDSCVNYQFINAYSRLKTRDLIQTPDGGYLLAGSSGGVTNGQGILLLKTDKIGNYLWHQAYSEPGTEDVSRIRNTRDGGFILIGSTTSYTQPQGEPLVIKLDSMGAVQWTRTMGAGSANGETGVDIIQTSDGGYALAANYNNASGTADWEVIRLDGSGNTIWAKTIGTDSTDNIGGILEDQDTLVLSGLSISTELGNPSSKYDGMIMKITKGNGNVIWAKSYDFDTRCNWFFDINKTGNGYIINSMMTDDYAPGNLGNMQHVVVEVNKNGDTLRVRKIASPPGAQTYYGTVYPTPDGGYISTQYEDSSVAANIHLLKTNSVGNIEWSNRIRFTDNQYIARIIRNSDGTYTGAGTKLTGASQSPILIRTDNLGKTGCYDSAENLSSSKPIIHQYNETITSSDLSINNLQRGLSGDVRPLTPTLNLCYHNTCLRTVTDTLFLCGRSEPVLPPVEINTINNCSDSTFFTISKSTELFNVYTDSIQNRFDSAYRARCMQAYLYEHFSVTHNVSEYHHTLYYYDQAGNLLKTVPPAGVQANYDSVWLDNVAAARAADQSLVPAHGLNTQYRYNTLNQVVAQQTPDAGQSRFWYDRLGRLAISQNARQKYVSTSEQGRQYSYTLYDYIGRITEVGQIANTGAAPMTDSISRVESNLTAWLTTSQAGKEQITQTVYDIPYAGFTGLSFTPIVQRNLRNRVSYTSFTTTNNPAQYNQGTFYTYDIEGNVDTLLQDYGSSTFSPVQNVMNLNGNRFKRLVYQYDLVSGKVNSVAYQPHQVDAFYHRYTYDAENRLTLAETSTDSVWWDKEARYEYYKHGPLARVILGDKMIQGLDYAYTLQGWLKGVNSTSLLPVYDMGRDGDTTSQNRYIARDIYGFGLNYYTGDYSAIGTGKNPFPGSSAFLNTADRPLFNGNISSMAVNLGALYRHQQGSPDTSHWRGPLLYSYRYDQLNRITGMDAYYGLNQTTNSWAGLMPTQDFKERVAYDGNGNIQRYKRNNFGETGLPMDSLGYRYIAGTNKLQQITDSADDAIGGGYDLHSQPRNNYTYDSIGNLIKDSSERISAIKWNVYGKITEINHRTTTAANPTRNIYYFYDAAGHRIGKKVTRGDTSAITYTWYVRDASGNVMSTYTATLDSSQALGDADLQLNEQHLYGSSRLGILTANRSADANTEGVNNYVSPWTGTHLGYYAGRKQYELTNHLGNVLATISDKKIGVSLSADSSLIDHYEADVQTAQDYYPFGMIMPGRMLATLSIPGGSFSGTTQVNGYTLPVDLTLSSRTGNQPTSYVATDMIELNDGFESGTNDDVTAYIADGSYAGGGNGSNDNAVAGGGKYRYGFNGQEKSDEIKGSGNSYTAEFWEYDPRIGQRWNLDPKPTIGVSPYAA